MSDIIKVFEGPASTKRGSTRKVEPSAIPTLGYQYYQPQIGGLLLADWKTEHGPGYTHRQVSVEHEDIPELIELLIKVYRDGLEKQAEWDAKLAERTDR